MLTRRSRAREVALQLLFQRDQNPQPVPRPAVEQFARDRLSDEAEPTAFCLALYDGVVSHQAEIDPKLSATAENWRLNRMLPVDRNVLRLGAYELLYDPGNQPVEVIIDEAIELARRFGSKDSPGFVNGILDRVSKMRGAEPGTPNPARPDPAPESPPAADSDS
jgi:N utilization substance protein B